MKTYTHQFLMCLGRKFTSDDSEIRTRIREVENELSRLLPDDFDIELLISVACRKFSITVDEYHSTFRYGNISRARQAVCYVLYFLGARNIQISRLTGFKPPRISNFVRAIKDDNESLVIIESILKLYNDEKTPSAEGGEDRQQDNDPR